MKLYEQLRKERATSTVNLALENRVLYHMEDGPKQQERDRQFAEHDWWDPEAKFPWAYADIASCKELYAFDALRDAEERFSGSGFGDTSRDHWHSTQGI
jgi:salicylate hydroxylase